MKSTSASGTHCYLGKISFKSERQSGAAQLHKVHSPKKGFKLKSFQEKSKKVQNICCF